MKDNDQTSLNPSSTISKIMFKSKTNPFKHQEKSVKANQNKYARLSTVLRPGLSRDLRLHKLSSKRNVLTNKQTTLALMKNLNFSDPNQQKIDEKFNLDQLGRIEFAKQHSSANRPLNKLTEELQSNQQYCRCCGLPCINKDSLEPFKVCDNTDKYSILGQAISLYFSFYKFSIFILLVLFLALVVPSIIMTNNYFFSITKICNEILAKSGNIEFSLCERFITDKEYLEKNNLQSKEAFKTQFNGANTNTYIELYSNIMSKIYLNDSNQPKLLDDKSHANQMNKLVINQSVAYFIVLMCLFIINLLYIVLQNNKILDYNFQLISPSDYAVIMTNMSHVYKSFRRMKYRYMRSNRISSKTEYRKKLGFTGKELNDKEITDAMEFGAYIKNFIINKNEKFNVELVNICYKLNKFKKLEEEIQGYKNELFKVDNNPRQIKRNRHFKLEGNRRKYFTSFLSDDINYFNLNTNCCEKRIPIMDILRKKKHKEHELNDLLEASKNIKKDNFANVAFISFDTISEQEKFLNQYSQNWLTGLLSTIKNLKYYFCHCLLSREEKNKWEKEKGESVSNAPEPDDIIFENLETTKVGRIIRTLITTLISLFIIAISFIIVVLLTIAQEKIDNMSFGAKNFSKYAVSLGITIVTSIVNIIFQGLLESLTKVERHISITDQNLSFSVKLTIFTFANSSIVPLISNALTNLNNIEINYDLLVSNILINFIVNAIVSPTMWLFNPGFFLKKWKIWNIESKKNSNMRHNMTQRELNELYEYIDIELAYKYSYIFKTLLMTFFYLPIFPLGIVFSLCGLILAFFLEKFNMGHIYKRPEMMNEAICQFYVHFFEVNFLMLAIGDYIFLNNDFTMEYWPIINIIVFFILLLIPYGQYLNFNLIGINQSQIINKKYDEVYFSFYNDYERMNPFTRKIGTINYLKRLKETDYISEEEFQIQKKNIEKLSFMQIMSQARPSRTNRAKRSLGKRQALLHNVVFDESDKKAKRLFELIKKLYQMPEEEDESFIMDDDIIRTNRVMKRNKNIPNIIHLVGTIFGTEDDEKENINTKIYYHDYDSETNEAKLSKDKKNLRKTAFFGKKVNLEKIKKTSPFIIKVSNKNKLNNNNDGNNNNLILDSNNNIINTNNNINTNINNNINTNINTTNNLISKDEEYSTNKILSEIRSEISRGGKNLIRFTNCSVHLNYQNKDESNTNDEKNKNENNNNFIDNIDDKKNNKNDNIIQINNNNNVGKNNNNKNNSKFPFVSNISVTINQFFDKLKSAKKEENISSERQKINNAVDINNDNENNDDDDNNDNNDKKEDIIEEKLKDNNNNYGINSKKSIHKIPLNRKEQEEMNKNNNNPINNIINIVLRNDDNNNNDNNNKTNDNEEGDTEREGQGGDVYFNKFFNNNTKK